MNPRTLLHNNDVVEKTATLETLTSRYTERAVSFIGENKARPFFLYMPHTFPHIPLAASTRFRGKSAEGLYGDVVEEIDWSVGEVLRAVRENGAEKNTLVMFSSDNGPWYQGSAGRLRGRKGSTFEGGVREPFLARWPGRIPAGRVSNAFASMMDVFPTVTKLCGGRAPAKSLDGVDIWPLLDGSKSTVEHDVVLYFDEWDLQCARWQDWKLHIARHNSPNYAGAPVGGRRTMLLPKAELYDLARDADESYDVAAERPEIVARIEERIAALMPTFPAEVRRAYEEVKSRPGREGMPAGAWPAARGGR